MTQTVIGSDALPKSEELLSLRSRRVMDKLYISAEQRYIKQIGEDWEDRTLKLFKKSSQFFESQTTQPPYLTLLAFVSDLSQEEDVWLELLSLSGPSIQEILLKTYKDLTSITLRSYFKVLKKLQVSEIVVLNDGISNLKQLAHSVQDTVVRQNVESLSLEFLTLAYNEAYSHKTGVNRLRSTIFVLLAGIYGEDKVASILRERRLNKIRFAEAVLIFLLENNPQEDMPLLWRLQFVTFESEHDPMFWMQKP